MNKMDELHYQVMNLDPDIIGVTETWAHDGVMNSELNLNGYTMFRKDRLNRRGGGLLLYIKEHLSATSNEEMGNTNFKESVWCDINNNGSELLLGVCYRSPDSDNLNDGALHDLLYTLCDKDVIIFGDFNHRTIDWDSLSARNRQDTLFLEATQDCFLHQHVREATRESAVLDLVFSSEVDMVENIEIRDHLGASDHSILTFDIITNVEILDSNRVYRDYKKGNYDKIITELKRINWKNVMDVNCTDYCWNKWKDTITKLVSIYIPVKKYTKRKQPMWMSNKVLKSIKRKYNCWKKYAEYRNYDDFVTYKRAQKTSKREIKNAKRYFELKLAKNIKDDPKSFYAYVRSKQKTKDRIGPLKDEEGNTINSPQETVNTLNNYFASVFTVETLVNMPVPTRVFNNNIGEELTSVHINVEEVKLILMKLKPDKSPGPDDMHPFLLKELAEVLCQPLSIILNKSIQNREVPDDWKKANVAAIFKKGSRHSPGNYRPVSLTSVICKTMETIIRDKIMDHLLRYNLIQNSQHGFMKGKILSI